MSSSELATLPHWGSSALAGLSVSAASIFALLPRHLRIVSDPVATLNKELSGQVSGEIAELVSRSNALWQQTKGELDADDTNRVLLQEAVLRLMHSAKRWTQADSRSAHTNATSLAERIESLSQRIDKADDDIVITHYEQARAALSEQVEYLRGISQNRERVLARLHNYLAAMERLRLAVAKLESTTASREAVDLAPIVEGLEELGQDIDRCSNALRDLEA